ncbi:MAG: 2,3-diphosphoglycerate-dependent phosphoglycerate mutase [Actinomycetota bacterium]|nr:2,3-diphosphoglycerate-dependent phosphoglycerate mutase [Actinomycetota bacterium]
MSNAHNLVLLRHGQSTWNLENIFTGWTDVPLSGAGEREAAAAGVLMTEANLAFDIVHTSVLRRAIDTASIALSTMDLGWIPVERHWRLNERHYGGLQGLNKAETAEQYGIDQVHIWRRSYSIAPPAVSASDDRHPSHDQRYSNLPPEVLPSTECLKDVGERMLPYWYDHIVPDLASRKTVLVVAHGNSLRALVKHLDAIEDDDIAELNIPTGVPICYELDAHFRVVSSEYLGDPDAVQAAAAAVAEQAG